MLSAKFTLRGGGRERLTQFLHPHRHNAAVCIVKSRVNSVIYRRQLKRGSEINIPLQEEMDRESSMRNEKLLQNFGKEIL